MALLNPDNRASNKSNLASEGQIKMDGDREPGEGVAMQLEEAGKDRMRSKSIKYHSLSLGV